MASSDPRSLCDATVEALLAVLTLSCRICYDQAGQVGLSSLVGMVRAHLDDVERMLRSEQVKEVSAPSGG